VEPLRVVEIHVVLNPEAQLRQTDILLDFDIFVLQRPPEAFHSGIVPATSASIHADLNPLPFQFGNELFAGELAALVRIEDLRPAVTRYRRPQRFDAMNRIHGIDHAVRHQLAAEPIHDADHERAASVDGGISDVGAPYLIAVIDFQPAQEIGKLPVRRMRDRGVEMRSWIYRAQPHLPMQTSNPLVVDSQPAPFQLRRQARNPVKRHIHIDIHDFVLGLFIGGDFGGGATLVIVITRPRHLEQTQLPTDA